MAGDDSGSVVDRSFATVGGGRLNTASGFAATVGGGSDNSANNFATVGGGEVNTASGFRATVGGGSGNTASDSRATVGGGLSNLASNFRATVGGGEDNTASDFRATVGGGNSNTASGNAATVGGGENNTASGLNATVGGGRDNIASGFNATVGGGRDNTASGDYSFVVGRRAKNSDASHDGVFIFADSENADFTSTGANQFLVRASGNVGINTGNPLAVLHVEGEAIEDLLRVRAAGATKLMVHDNGGTSVGANVGPPTNGLAVFGNITKGGGSFKIDHPLDPENKYLYHSFVESPDMMNIYNGNVTTDASGQAIVELPEWFDALNRDFRYQLTVIGTFARAIVLEKIKDNRFVIATDAPAVEVSWQVTGIRHDPYAEMNRIQVEEDKPEAERGKLLHPEAWGEASVALD